MLINYPIPGCVNMSITEKTEYKIMSKAICIVLTAKKKKRKQIRKQQKKLFFQLMATENYNKRLMVYAQIKQLNRELVKVLHVCACVPLVPRRKSKTKPLHLSTHTATQLLIFSPSHSLIEQPIQTAHVA